MINEELPGLGFVDSSWENDFIELKSGGNGRWKKGENGVKYILTPRDRKVEFIIFSDKTLVYVKSAMGYPAIYPLNKTEYNSPAKYVLMDLDGTSVHSESFWMWIIEKTVSRLMNKPDFKLSEEDEPHVSGHSVSEHLQYCIDKYCPDKEIEQAREHYFEITRKEMKKIERGEGKTDAFQPAPGLKEFLLTLKENDIKIGLVTSGLYEKAWPEILSAFRTMNMGDPLEFYDAFITAGHALRKGQAGTLGELEPKPHPWLYAETAKVGLGIKSEQRDRVIGIEDSAAGVLSIRMAGFTTVGIKGGNINQSGVGPLLDQKFDNLVDALPFILGSK